MENNDLIDCVTWWHYVPREIKVYTFSQNTCHSKAFILTNNFDLFKISKKYEFSENLFETWVTRYLGLKIFLNPDLEFFFASNYSDTVKFRELLTWPWTSPLSAFVSIIKMIDNTLQKTQIFFGASAPDPLNF